MRRMNHINTTPTSVRRLRIALPLLAGATLLFGACGGGDDAEADAVDTVLDDTMPPAVTDTDQGDAPIETVGDAAGTEPAKACGLLDTATVDSVLGTSGVTTSVDTSLGFFDGCRWATANTDVPALLIGYDPTADFQQIRDLACDGATPEPILALGVDSVACFGVVVAPAGTGVVMVSIDDPLDQWDDAGELDLATRFAITVVTASAG